jgi:hypothetical protein
MCPICYNGNKNGYEDHSDNFVRSNIHLQPAIESHEKDVASDQYTETSSNFASIRSRGCSRRSSDIVPRISAFSKESGFQSSYSSTSSVYSGSRVPKNIPDDSASVSISVKERMEKFI